MSVTDDWVVAPCFLRRINVLLINIIATLSQYNCYKLEFYGNIFIF